jgi:Uncharacterised protein family UPF0547/Phospholipase_D-nuclease N-terminal
MSATVPMLADGFSHNHPAVVLLLVIVAPISFLVAWFAPIVHIWRRTDGVVYSDFKVLTRLQWLFVVILFPLLGTIAYVLFGRKRGKDSPPPLVGGHDVRRDTNGWTCREENCSFESPMRDVARQHRVNTGAVLRGQERAVASTPATTLPVASPPAPAAPEFKTCPDCAEEVRAAARKCRFCGYLFEDVAAKG